VQFKFPRRLSVRWPASAMLGGVATHADGAATVAVSSRV